MEGIGYHRTEGEFPASSLFIEYYIDTDTPNNQTKVRVYYKKMTN